MSGRLCDWKSDEKTLAKFVDKMRAEQQLFGPSCKHWFVCKLSEEAATKLRIAVSFFDAIGPAQIEQGITEVVEVLRSYSKEQREFIDKVYAVLAGLFTRSCATIKISRIMLGLKNGAGDDHELRTYLLVVRAKDKTYFIDTIARKYTGWEDFKRHGRISGYVVAPQGGVYLVDRTTGGYVLDDFWMNKDMSMAKVSDYVALAFGAAGGVVLALSLFMPLMSPYFIACASTMVKSAAVWGGLRCGNGLYDRGTHAQPIFSRDCATLWIGLFAAFAGGLAAHQVASGCLAEVSIGAKLLRAVAVVAGAPAANLCAIVAVDRGRLSPENEAMIIAMSVFAAYNVLITVDEAHNLRMLSVEDAAAKTVGGAVNTLQLGDAIKEVLTKFGIANDAEELPLVVSRELRGFTDYVTKANADAFLGHLISGLKAMSLANTVAMANSGTLPLPLAISRGPMPPPPPLDEAGVPSSKVDEE